MRLRGRLNGSNEGVRFVALGTPERASATNLRKTTTFVALGVPDASERDETPSPKVDRGGQTHRREHARVPVVVLQQQHDGGDHADADGRQPGEAGEVHATYRARRR